MMNGYIIQEHGKGCLVVNDMMLTVSRMGTVMVDNGWCQQWLMRLHVRYTIRECETVDSSCLIWDVMVANDGKWWLTISRWCIYSSNHQRHQQTVRNWGVASSVRWAMTPPWPNIGGNSSRKTPQIHEGEAWGSGPTTNIHTLKTKIPAVRKLIIQRLLGSCWFPGLYPEVLCSLKHVLLLNYISVEFFKCGLPINNVDFSFLDLRVNSHRQLIDDPNWSNIVDLYIQRH